MGQLETRYETGKDATYRTVDSVRVARLLTLAGSPEAPKPGVWETSANDGSQIAVGAALADKATNEDVTVVHRGFQKLFTAAAVVLGEYVYSASGGRVRGAAPVGFSVTALAPSARPYGIALSPAAVDGNVWVKVLGNNP